LFQEDRPTLFRRLSRGLAIAGYLNVEVPKVRHRRVDLLIALADGALPHVEFQSAHDQHIGYRMMEYWALIKRRHGRPLRQVVVSWGREPAFPIASKKMARSFVMRCWTCGTFRRKI